MKGARVQLLDVENKTQYQPSRWSSVTHVHALHETLSCTGWQRQKVCKIYEDSASVSFG